MDLEASYDFKTVEPHWQRWWLAERVYAYDRASQKQVFSIDTPPPTVSGKLHIGHVSSYTQTDAIARYQRMLGREVFYPMGYDDNGLPTEILTERECGVKAESVGRERFNELCLEVCEKFRALYRGLWQSLGFSVDWDQSYSTISPECRRVSQLSFLDLAAQGRLYRAATASLWCTRCRTSIAQAELEAQGRPGVFHYFSFKTPLGELPIASTRPELLPACVAVFVHPEDARFRRFIGTRARVPIFDIEVPVRADAKADPEKGTGVVMCCTYGDATDVAWTREHQLVSRVCLGEDGRLNAQAGVLAGSTIAEARVAIVERLKSLALISAQKEIPPEQHVVNTHERCGTEIEYLETRQWFVRLLDAKEELLRLGEKVRWFPAHMKVRYRNWVEGLHWDWAVSRQRYFGVPIPAWDCARCGSAAHPEPEELPVNPLKDRPSRPCRKCGGTEFTPDKDVLDTWATSSVTPQICAKWRSAGADARLVPMSLRPQAHDIIRTWAFYTIAKSAFHSGDVPWRDAAISGHVVKKDAQVEIQQVAGSKVERKSKISKSKDADRFSPQRLLETYPADCIRWWTCSSRLGLDVIFDEKEIAAGEKLLTKLWNATRFALSMLGEAPPFLPPEANKLQENGPERAFLSRLKNVVQLYHAAFAEYEFSAARSEIERFFWSDFCDHYIEYVKEIFYKAEKHDAGQREAAAATLGYALYAALRLFAPFLPHITEEIYQRAFRTRVGARSIHLTRLPMPEELPYGESDLRNWEDVKSVVNHARGHKSQFNYSLRQPLRVLYLSSEIKARLAGFEGVLCAVTASAAISDNPHDVDQVEELKGIPGGRIGFAFDEKALAVTRLAAGLRGIAQAGKQAAGLKANAAAGTMAIYAGKLSQSLAGTEELFAAALKVRAVQFLDASEIDLQPSAGGELQARFLPS